MEISAGWFHDAHQIGNRWRHAEIKGSRASCWLKKPPANVYVRGFMGAWAQRAARMVGIATLMLARAFCCGRIKI
jgi:hypothetical protein